MPRDTSSPQKIEKPKPDWMVRWERDAAAEWTEEELAAEQRIEDRHNRSLLAGSEKL